MGDKSAIEWTDATWNPVTGCSKVSPGCAHCYAETLALTRLAGQAGYPGLPWTPENAAANVTLRPDRLTRPLRWTRPRRIFVNSMSDLFHELVPDEFIDQVFSIMALATGHTFQLLTKRPERMRAWANAAWGGTFEPAEDRGNEVWRGAYQTDAKRYAAAVKLYDDGRGYGGQPWPLPNVWLGTSVENQHWADVRIPELLATPAAVRFLSMEPLLGPVDLGASLGYDWQPIPAHEEGWRLDWLIVGGESGPIHREMDPEWVRAIRDQATTAGIPFLFKQWGGRTSKAGGRELDGRTWDEYPA